MRDRELDKKIAALEAKLRLPTTEAEHTKAERALSALRSYCDEAGEVDAFLAAIERWRSPDTPDWLREAMERADASATKDSKRIQAGLRPLCGIHPSLSEPHP